MKLLRTEERVNLPARLFGHHFPLGIEPRIYTMAGRLSADYNGGYWEMYDLEPGFLMVPPPGSYRVVAENGAKLTLGAEAFGITVCLYTYSLLSFQLDVCIEQFHRLRQVALDHPEAAAIMRAID
ncbi:MAG: antirestriction protein [Desulfurivibrionaceae bacterium]